MMQRSTGQLDGVDVGQLDRAGGGALPIQMAWTDLLDIGQFEAVHLARVEGASVPESLEIPEQREKKEDIDRIFLGLKSTGHLQPRVSEAPSSSGDLADGQLASWHRDFSLGSSLGAEFFDRQTTFDSLSLGRQTSSSSEPCAPPAPQAASGAASRSWDGGQLSPASQGDETTKLPHQVPPTALPARQQSTASSLASADKLVSAQDTVRQLWMTDGISKHSAAWWLEHFAPDCECEDLGRRGSHHGLAAVQAMLPSLMPPPGTRRVVTNISGEISSCGFAWHVEEDGVGILQRGVTYLCVDRHGRVTYLREGCEPPSQVSISPTHGRVLARQAPAPARPSRRQRPRAAQEALAACGGLVAVVMLALLVEGLLPLPVLPLPLLLLLLFFCRRP